MVREENTPADPGVGAGQPVVRPCSAERAIEAGPVQRNRLRVRRSRKVRWRGWHVRVVGALSLPWNFVSAADYAMSEFRNQAYLTQVARQMGARTSDLIAYIDSLPAWAVAAWAIGSWGSVVGSLLLLTKDRAAVWAFAVSLAGLAVLTLHFAISEKPEWADVAVGRTIVAWTIAIGLLSYAEFARRRNYLR